MSLGIRSYTVSYPCRVCMISFVRVALGTKLRQVCFDNHKIRQISVISWPRQVRPTCLDGANNLSMKTSLQRCRSLCQTLGSWARNSGWARSSDSRRESGKEKAGKFARLQDSSSNTKNFLRVLKARINFSVMINDSVINNKTVRINSYLNFVINFST